MVIKVLSLEQFGSIINSAECVCFGGLWGCELWTQQPRHLRR